MGCIRELDKGRCLKQDILDPSVCLRLQSRLQNRQVIEFLRSPKFERGPPPDVGVGISQVQEIHCPLYFFTQRGVYIRRCCCRWVNHDRSTVRILEHFAGINAERSGFFSVRWLRKRWGGSL